MSSTKICTNCGKMKESSEFYNRTLSKDGKTSKCKDCVLEYNSNHKLDIRKASCKSNLKSHGLTVEDYYRILEEQGGRCAICQGLPEETCPEQWGKKLCVDHDHITGEVRGLLCMNCNTGLGRFEDKEDNLQRAIQYLKGVTNVQAPA